VVDVVFETGPRVTEAPGERFALPEPEDEQAPSKHAHTQSTSDKRRHFTTKV
jgi:hypothetical protein